MNNPNEKLSQAFTLVDRNTVMSVVVNFEEARLLVSLKIYDNSIGEVHQDWELNNPSFFAEPYQHHSYFISHEGLLLAANFRLQGGDPAVLIVIRRVGVVEGAGLEPDRPYDCYSLDSY